MPQIIPINNLKNTSKISDMCRESAEPIYITKNGYGDMVIMSLELYEKFLKQSTMYRDLEVSEQQIKKGMVKDARESLISLREKYGL